MSQGDSFDSFGFDDVDPDAPGSRGGRERLPEGGYLFAITDVIVQNEKGSTQIECEVLFAKDGNLVGRKHVEYLPWPDSRHGQDYNRIKKILLRGATRPKPLRREIRRGSRPVGVQSGVARSDGRPAGPGIRQVDTYTGNDGNEKTSASARVVSALDNPRAKHSRMG